jgi:hypothetical protein
MSETTERSSSPWRMKRWLGWLGPFFGLAFVTSTFAAMLAIKDMADYRAALPSGESGGWMRAARESGYDGLRAFVSVSNMKTVLAQTVIVATGALGMTIVIASGGIDLSAGSVVALTSVVGATLLEREWGTANVVEPPC